MTINHVEKLIELMKAKQIAFELGLTDDEIYRIENKYGIIFPPDLRLFLQTEFPISEGFLNWRLGLKSDKESKKIIKRINWPLEGMLFDLKSNDFWLKSWEEKPNDPSEREKIVKERYYSYPKLIPIYSHRYIPSEPNEENNPIFSVYQMDIIYYGYDLATYFANEFNFELTNEFQLLQKPKKEIKFWSYWVEFGWQEE